MERIKIKVDKRDGLGKEKVKKLRKAGYIPAIVYSEDINMAINVHFSNLKALRAINFSESAVIDMEIAGEKKHKTIPTLIKDVQFHPLREAVIHIDFLKVSLKEKIKVHVPIALKGETKAVKEGEGVIEQILRELEVEALPLDIPEKIELDISELTIGHSLHVEDLKVSDNLRVITDGKAAVVTIVLKKEEELEEPAPAEGEEAPSEPEVIKEKKDAAEEPKEEKPKGDKAKGDKAKGKE